jgi:hypothetical protein
MAVSGGNKPCVRMEITDGVLVQHNPGMSTQAVDDVDLAVQRLFGGQTVYVAQYGGTHIKVEHKVAQTLALLREARERNGRG